MRDEILASLRPLDVELMTAARRALPPDSLAALQRQAEEELGHFKTRLAADAWDRAMEATINRLLRERFALPVVDPDEA